MSSEPRTGGFKERDAASYDDVTRPFDRFGDRFTALLADRLIRLTGLPAQSRVLDVGTGTGVVAFAAARELDGSGGVVGVDLSEGMLSTAREKALQLGVQVDFRRMDAESLDLEDKSFDRAFSLFALTHLPNPAAGLGEMHRVLRSGGRLAVGVGSGPPLTSLPGWFHRFGRLRDEVLARAGTRLIAPDFLNALVESHLPKTEEPTESSWALEHHNRSRVLPRLIRDAGFVQVRTHWQGQTASLETPAEFWDLQATISTRARKRFAAAPEEAKEALRAEFFSICERVEARGGRFLYPYAAFYVSASRP